jgi:hypothetical protein
MASTIDEGGNWINSGNGCRISMREGSGQLISVETARVRRLERRADNHV